MASSSPAPWGAVCLLCALSLGMLFSSTLHASTQPDTSAPWREPIRALWTINPDVQVARADLDAAYARARAADQPLYNPALAHFTADGRHFPGAPLVIAALFALATLVALGLTPHQEVAPA